MTRVVQGTVRILNLIRKVFPEIRTTRFANSADFYSLFLLFWELDQQGAVFLDSKRNREAQALLINLSQGVAAVRMQQRKAEGTSPEQRLFADYLLTVQGDTDSHASRQRRAEILRKVIGGLFEKKDGHRGFTPEQRSLMWHASKDKKCSGCGEMLDWDTFTVDHVVPHARGGKTSILNAVLMCRECNSRKGKRDIRPKRNHR